MKWMYHEKLGPREIAIADLIKFRTGYLITRINVPARYREMGHARNLLARIIKDADEEKQDLFLEIFPSDGLSYSELYDWYARAGFKLVGINLYRRSIN